MHFGNNAIKQNPDQVTSIHSYRENPPQFNRRFCTTGEFRSVECSQLGMVLFYYTFDFCYISRTLWFLYSLYFLYDPSVLSFSYSYCVIILGFHLNWRHRNYRANIQTNKKKRTIFGTETINGQHCSIFVTIFSNIKQNFHC